MGSEKQGTWLKENRLFAGVGQMCISECASTESTLQLSGCTAWTCWGPRLALVQHTGPEVVRHTAPRQNKHGTETDSGGKTKRGRAVASTHAAALVLQGTQPGSIVQALNAFNVCNHAMCKVGAGGVGITFFNYSWDMDGGQSWLGLGSWNLATG